MEHHAPEALEDPVKHRHHGIVREDPWHWLREREDPRVLAHLRAENAYTDSVMAAAGDLPDRLYEELIGRIEESNRSAPYPDGQFLYQSRIEKGQDYRMYFRRPRDGEGEWTCYFDANQAAGEHAYFELGFLEVSPDGRILAYATDTVGEESYTLRFRDLHSGEDLPLVIEAVSAEGEWDAGSAVFYFLREDETRRSDRIFRIAVDARDSRAAELLYHEKDPLFYAGIYKSQDGRYLFACSASKETTEVHFLAAGAPGGQFQCLFPRRFGIQYWVEHREGEWLIRTNEKAPDFRLLALPVDEPDPAMARELLPAQAGVRLTDILPLRQHLVLMQRANGLDQIRIRDLTDGSEQLLPVPDEVYDLSPGNNAEYDTVHFQFDYSSPIRPSLTLQCDLLSGRSGIIRQTAVPSGHDPSAYTVYRIQAVSFDQTEVPMTVIHRGDLPRDGSRPAYLYGYGAYGSPVEASFRTSWLTWLERGFTVAIAHVRGGGLLGEEWYRAGKLASKENTFKDFIACAEKLIAGRYTRSDRLVIEGGSAGGLLVGAVLNQRPDLFRAAVAAVPFVDVLNAMLDPSLPLTTFEYEEWGNPQNREDFETILSYSPYDNVRPARYPGLLVTAGFHDPHAPYWGAAKWVARLRKHQLADHPILLETNLRSGHSGASARYDAWKETARAQAFLLSQLGTGQGLPERD